MSVCDTLSLQDQFQNVILDHLAHLNHANAIFLAERLREQSPTDETKLLLAECYVADHQFASAFHLLKGVDIAKAKYLQAFSAFKMDKLADAEAILSKCDRTPHVNFLLGQVYEKQKKSALASEFYLKAFKKDPTLFVAAEKFALLLPKPKPSDFDTLIVRTQEAKENFVFPFAISKSFAGMGQGSEIETPNMKISAKKLSLVNSLKKSRSPELNSGFESVIKNEPDFIKQDLFSSLKPFISFQNRSVATKPSEKDLEGSGSKIGTLLLNKGKLAQSSSKVQMKSSFAKQTIPGSPNPNSKSIFDYLLTLMRPYFTMLIKSPNEALPLFEEALEVLPKDSWLHLQTGRCHTELYNHVAAEKSYRNSFALDPFRARGLEHFSSCLWHLKKLPELTQLASAAVERHYFAPESWIAMANCYSLAQDNDSAITFLNRAIQLDRSNTYAHCLLGHEFLAKDLFEKAKESYLTALKLDPRNTRACWGLGILNSKMEKFDHAIHYFSQGVSFNDQCAPFYTQLSVCYLNDLKLPSALTAITKAENLAPQDQYNKFVKAQILVQMRRHEEALSICGDLIKSSPKEASVYLLMSQVYKALGNVEAAYKNLTFASGLDKKDANKLNRMMSELHNKALGN